MIVVDSSVWIDFLNGADTREVETLVRLIELEENVALTAINYTEVLQGLRTEAEADLVGRHLRSFPVIALEAPGDYELAARLYRHARRAGITIRKTLDLLIAAPCVRTGATLLHSDRDFDLLASCTDLRIFDAERRG